MIKKVTANQVGILIFFSIVSLKFLVFPAVFSSYAGNNGYIALILNLVLDFSSIFSYLYVMKKNPDTDFKTLLEGTIGKFATKIVFILLLLYFVFKALFVAKETHSYFLETLFDELEWASFVLPLLVLMGFIMTKSFRVLARSMEIFIYFVLFGILIAYLISITSFQSVKILPLLGDGIKPVLDASFHCGYAFGDYLIIVLFLGDVQTRKHGLKPIVWYSIFGLALVSIYYIIFFGVFGNVAVSQGTSISAITLHILYPNTLGRLDWLSIILWTFTLLLQMAGLLIASKKCFDVIYKFKHDWTTILIILFSMLVAMFLLYLNLELVLKIVTNSVFLIFAVGMQVVIPTLLCLCNFFYKPPEGETHDQEVKVSASRKRRQKLIENKGDVLKGRDQVIKGKREVNE